MRNLVVIVLIASSCFGEYQSAKIDMHGGKESYLYDNKKSSFGKNSMGMSIFLDKNTSKKSLKKKEKK